jgi:uncharacterized protein
MMGERMRDAEKATFGVHRVPPANARKGMTMMETTRHATPPDDGGRSAIRARGMEEVSTRECLELLAGARVGRIGVIVAGRPEIFPVNYVLDLTGAIVFQTAPGMKLAAAVNHHVVFEVDDATTKSAGWSVVVHGVAHQTTLRSLRFAGRLPAPWARETSNTMRIQATSITGRRFAGTGTRV